MTEQLEERFSYGTYEKEILLYLYNHPETSHDTANLAFHLRAPEVKPGELPSFDAAYTEKQRLDVLETQHAVETLILERCIEGTREELGSAIQFSKIRLTKKGEEEAIRAKRNLEKLTAAN